jgi:hypothetical protein
MAFWVVLSTLSLSTNEATADIIYEWVNLPADQDGAQLSGTITTDGTIGFITESNILTWSFTVAKTGYPSYSASSTASNASIFIDSTSSLETTTNSLELNGEFTIGLNIDQSTGQTLIRWNPANVTQLYFSNSNSSVDPGWVTFDPAGFGGGNVWTIANVSAVPEPGSLGMFGLLLVGAALRRRRDQ